MTDNPKPNSLPEWLGIANAPNWAVSRPLGVLFGVCLMLLFTLALVAAFVVTSSAIVSAFNPQTGGPNLGVGALIVALLGGPFLIWRTMVAQRTVDLQKEGLMTDRISKAVEQLGAEKTVKEYGIDEAGKPIPVERTVPNIEVRIGGLLSLERISQDSVKYDKGRDHVRVMEILCAYVRENAKASGAVAPPSDENALESWKKELRPPRDDITIALNIIGRRSAGQLRAEACWGPDAHRSSEWPFAIPAPRFPDRQQGVTQPLADITGYASEFTKWQETFKNYTGYRLDLAYTNLQNSDLSKMNLAGINLRGARLDYANLEAAQLQGGNFRWAHCVRTFFTRSNASAADFNGAHLQAANFRDAQLAGSTFRAAHLQGTRFIHARLERADLETPKINEASEFTSAFLWLATFGRNFAGTKSVNDHQLRSTFGDGSVKLKNNVLPDHPDWPDHWPKHELDKEEFAKQWKEWRAGPENYKPPLPPAS